MIKYIIFIIIGFFLLIKGADFLVNGASSLAKKFRIPNIVIGLTIVSIGTSAPELFVSITSSIQKASDISVGNVIGSNLCNLLFILGTTAIIKDIQFKSSTKYIEIPFLIFTNILFFVLVQDGILSQKESCILVFLFICFLTYTYLESQKNQTYPQESIKEISILGSIFSIIIGIIALKYGGEFVVENAKRLAKLFKVSDKIIGCTIIAIGTSLPELITSIVSAKRGNTDLALGNIIGSNIFNVLLILGISSFINTIHFNLNYNLDIIILYTASLLLFLFPHFAPKNYMSKKEGFLFLGTYLVYMLITVLH
ncbi:MAG: calcium/sodium antiporter [Clostridia bacterium]|nr:calcium/sodium antiporter [Clostridia bacterium]